jgi:poly(A) polymerase
VTLLDLFEANRATPLPKLVTGKDVMEVLGIPPGPEVGKALREIRELQEHGELTDRPAALAHLGRRARG